MCNTIENGLNKKTYNLLIIQKNKNMFLGWFEKPPRKIGFEDVKYALDYPTLYLIINTLSISEQDCLIKNTLPCGLEETTLNEMMSQYSTNNKILIVYGKNSCDQSVEKKCKQLAGLGFTEVYLYSGGLFEWLLLQDIYGFNDFPTTRKELDVLKYRHQKTFNVPRIGYNL